MAVGNGTHAGGKGAIFIFGISEKRSLDEVVLPGNPVFGAFREWLKSIGM